MHLFDVDRTVAAAAIAATGTVIGSLIQLRVTWRRELAERARSAPVTRKSRRGPVLAIGLLLGAAVVGGFALSQYLTGQSNRESLALRGRIDQARQSHTAGAGLRRSTRVAVIV